jgi:hypothetical protein
MMNHAGDAEDVSIPSDDEARADRAVRDALMDTERLRFVARNHGVSLSQLRRDIDRGMSEQGLSPREPDITPISATLRGHDS